MAKRLSRDEKNQKAIVDLINKMFEIAGHDLKFEDVEGRKDHWFQEHTMTEAQNEEWREWGIKLIMKKRRYNKFLADREMRMLDLYCGLKISDSKYGKQENTDTQI